MRDLGARLLDGEPPLFVICMAQEGRTRGTFFRQHAGEARSPPCCSPRSIAAYTGYLRTGTQRQPVPTQWTGSGRIHPSASPKEQTGRLDVRRAMGQLSASLGRSPSTQKIMRKLWLAIKFNITCRAGSPTELKSAFGRSTERWTTA
ncbi:uncharacterized protein SCHCODRAFT_02492477 [Schizophyllum commune H4-8]|uniref:uncharacterized protein n=1 Tax=Schizophyllum commune (strain H4-8 / FGSC 9210) TaxID=578458 RepID=UPI0021600D48|nr:uncharacterized protein SCHCODRAFT_02492477 [Schizophyllum commune H4-8]KAI5896563.1 hypothetical protein SCHCODRAFT_02492477 [Schizophyllum commune H4-8]